MHAHQPDAIRNVWTRRGSGPPWLQSSIQVINMIDWGDKVRHRVDCKGPLLGLRTDRARFTLVCVTPLAHA